MKRPFEVYILCSLLLILSINAMFAGFLMIAGIDVKGLSMPISQLENSPFSSFLIPGILLFCFNGLLPLLAFIGIAFKPLWNWPNLVNIYRDKHWGWTYSIYVSVIVITWILIQITMIEFSILQPIIGGIGLLILVLTLLPRMLRYYTV